MEAIGWVCFAGFLVAGGWGLNSYLRLKDIEIDLTTQLGDLLVSRDTALDEICRCCAQSRVLELKAFIRRHFKL